MVSNQSGAPRLSVAQMQGPRQQVSQWKWGTFSAPEAQLRECSASPVVPEAGKVEGGVSPDGSYKKD